MRVLILFAALIAATLGTATARLHAEIGHLHATLDQAQAEIGADFYPPNP